jgi:hypothetical protein
VEEMRQAGFEDEEERVVNGARPFAPASKKPDDPGLAAGSGVQVQQGFSLQGHQPGGEAIQV